jgi:micrococcal nuclease
MKILKKFGRGSLLTALVALLFAYFGINPDQSNKVVRFLTTNQPGFYSVIQIVDGDTIAIDMNGVEEKIRFIGLDTPEKNHPEKPVQCFAQAATEHLEDLMGNSRVRLESDPTNQNRDRYDRLLRYVYLPDGTLLNKQQILDGYGFAYLAFPFTKIAEFEKAESQARQDSRGLWSSCNVELNNGYLNTEYIKS